MKKSREKNFLYLFGSGILLLCPSFLWAMGAPAGGGQAKGGADWGGLIMLLVIFAIFYFLLIRPQQKRTREHQEMIKSLKRGDDVISSGGIYGRIAEIDGDVILLEVAEKVKIRVAKDQISVNRSVAPKPAAAEKKPREKGQS